MSADSLKRFLILSVGAVYLASVPWAYRDAERRGQSGPLVALVVGLVSWPFGLLAWLFTRPARRSG